MTKKLFAALVIGGVLALTLVSGCGGGSNEITIEPPEPQSEADRKANEAGQEFFNNYMNEFEAEEARAIQGQEEPVPQAPRQSPRRGR